MSDWKAVPLKSLASLNDEVLHEGTDPTTAISYVEISDVSEFGGIRWASPVAFGTAPSRARRVVRDGDVLISTVRTYLKAVAGVTSAPAKAIASTGFAVFRPRRVHPAFLKYAVLQRNFLDEVVSRSVGISYPAINPAEIAAIKILAPGRQTQCLVADYLDRETAEIDAFIADQNKLIELLTERRVASVRARVTRGIDSRARLEASGIAWIGDMPAGWATRKLASIAHIGNGSTPARENPAYWSDGDIPWLSSSAVNQVSITTPSDFVTSRAKAERHLPWVPAGSLVVGLTGQGKTRGTVGQLAIPTTISQHLAYVSPLVALENRFAFWALSAAYEELRLLSDGNGGTKGGLTCEDLGTLQIPLPDVAEQRAISAVLDAETAETDAAIADALIAISLSKERRAALISAAVTGKIDVREHGKANA